jgi:UDP-glucose 4-epimerase
LLEAGYDVLVLDNFSNSKKDSLQRVEVLSGRKVHFIYADVRNVVALREVFNSYPIEGVIHFAGLKSIGESVNFPFKYYDNNVSGSMALIKVMAEFEVNELVFSSTAAVYGGVESPIQESSALFASNPYAHSKLMVEQICNDLTRSNDLWSVAILRYFNPVGAHASGQIGEHTNGVPSNLMPNICRVAVREADELEIYGNDYSTVDGTGVRDYIHVMDLAEGHVRALAWIKNNTGAHVFNLGTGHGFSVLEIVKTFEQVSGVGIPYKISPRRLGDLPIIYADTTKAEKELGWKAELGIQAMCKDAWNWQEQNPQGYVN